MIEWLNKYNIQFKPDMKKAELLEVINLQKPRFPKYAVDELAKDVVVPLFDYLLTTATT